MKATILSILFHLSMKLMVNGQQTCHSPKPNIVIIVADDMVSADFDSSADLMSYNIHYRVSTMLVGMDQIKY
jgi:hypothetical protein